MGRRSIPSIKIDFEEKDLYRIFKKLETHGRAGFNYEDKQKQAKIARTIGIKGKPLVEKKMLYPPAKCKYHGINLVALPVDVEVVEKKLGRFSLFQFKRKF